MIVTSATEMRALDRWTIEHGTPGHVLMERAGVGATRVLRAMLPRAAGPIVVVCGKGNNGGDGFVIARHLRRAHIPVEVWLVGRQSDVQGDAARMLASWGARRGTVREIATADDVTALTVRLGRAAAIVDALFGTGLNAPVTGVPALVIEAVNAAGAPVLAVDIASGLSADTGHALGTAVHAAATATFALPKIGQCLYPGVEHTGRLEVVEIGIPAEAIAAVGPKGVLLDAAEVGRLLPRRRRDAHKGSFGHVLVVAGSRGKSGAALLAAEAAARSGAGLTTLAVPASLQSVVEGHVREAMTATIPHDPSGAELADLLAGRAAVVCGPGLGLTADTRALVAAIIRTCTAPLVLDADGLNAVAGTDVLRERTAPTVITPHPGEMARLLECDTTAVQADRVAAARGLAERWDVVVVLKGARTVIAAPGGEVAICPTGNPGMASGGMGDALSGLIGALLAQRLSAFDAARLGVFAHGAAADAIAARRGEAGLLARDLIEELPPTLAALQRAAEPAAKSPRPKRRRHA